MYSFELGRAGRDIYWPGPPRVNLSRLARQWFTGGRQAVEPALEDAGLTVRNEYDWNGERALIIVPSEEHRGAVSIAILPYGRSCPHFVFSFTFNSDRAGAEAALAVLSANLDASMYLGRGFVISARRYLADILYDAIKGDSHDG